MNNLYEELLKHDLNPYLLFDSNGKIKSYNIEAEFLMSFVTVKELFELAISNASINFGFNKKYISLKYDKFYFYAILVRNFTTFFHPFHKLPSTFSTIKQALKL